MSNSIFDFLIMGSGLYLIYTAMVMKAKGQITKGVYVSKDVNVERIRDKDGFIRYMFGRALLTGALVLAVGTLDLMNTGTGGPAWVSMAAVMGYIALMLVFALFSVRARKQFI